MKTLKLDPLFRGRCSCWRRRWPAPAKRTWPFRTCITGLTTSSAAPAPWQVLFYGACVIAGTLGISLYQLYQIHKQPAHKSMLDVAEIIFQTCKTYLIQQGKFLLMLFVIIAVADDLLLH